MTTDLVLGKYPHKELMRPRIGFLMIYTFHVQNYEVKDYRLSIVVFSLSQNIVYTLKVRFLAAGHIRFKNKDKF